MPDSPASATGASGGGTRSEVDTKVSPVTSHSAAAKASTLFSSSRMRAFCFCFDMCLDSRITCWHWNLPIALTTLGDVVPSRSGSHSPLLTDSAYGEARAIDAAGLGFRPCGSGCDDSAVVAAQGDVPLVGREPELTVLRAAASDAADGNPGAVLVAGEAGVGKSRLVRAMLEGLPVPEALVVRAQCVDLGDPGLPYLAMVDLVRGLQAVAGADPEVASVLDRLPVVATLTDPKPAGEASVDESRRLQLFDAVAALLAGVGRVRGPVVVAVEDLQWVDASSADFLRFLLSRMASERLMVVATVRTDGLAARPRVRRLLSELRRLPSVQRLDLVPFDAAEVAEYLARLAGGDHDPEVAAEVFRLTRGNPYYVQTLAAAGVGPGSGVDEGLPRALADLLVGRLDGLPDDARTVSARRRGCHARRTRPAAAPGGRAG